VCRRRSAPHRASWTVKNVPLALTANTRSHSSDVTSSVGSVVMMPAQVTRPSRWPEPRPARPQQPPALRHLEHALDLRQLRHVGTHVTDLATQLTGGRLEPIAVEIRQHQPGAFADRRARDGLPHARGNAGCDEYAGAGGG